jgi:hypothetical protein
MRMAHLASARAPSILHASPAVALYAPAAAALIRLAPALPVFKRRWAKLVRLRTTGSRLAQSADSNEEVGHKPGCNEYFGPPDFLIGFTMNVLVFFKGHRLNDGIAAGKI